MTWINDLGQTRPFSAGRESTPRHDKAGRRPKGGATLGDSARSGRRRSKETSSVDYAQQQRSVSRHMPGIVMVIVMHIVVGYALVTGLARRVVDVIKAPIETKIIEEIKKPPPDTPPPPPPKLAAPPPPFIPPPEVNIQVPIVQQAPTITTVTTTPPPPAA